MEGFKEFQGKDLDDAIGHACSYYDTLREKLEIDIIHDAKSGIFGIVGARKAKIKARRVQLRNAVDSILGRNREGGAPEQSPPPNKNNGRAPRNAAQSEKAPRTAESRPAENRSAENQTTEARPAENRSGENRTPHPSRTPASPRQPEIPLSEYHNDGNSILSGQVLGFTPDPENDEEASFGPGNEIPADGYGYAAQAPALSRDDRSSRPRRPRPVRTARPEGHSPRPERAERSERPERAERPDRVDRADRADRAERADRPDRADRADRSERSDNRNFRSEGPMTSVLAGTLDSDALNEDALSEGLPMIPFEQLDQDRLRAVSLEAVGRLVAPIVGDVPLTVELGDNRVNVVLDCGDDSGLLIGREGQTLASLQYLASRLVSRAMEAAVRVQLDAGEYRLRQDEKLRELALSLAERVRSTGKSYSTRPLSSYHRRIVHMALQEVADVQTRSSGDGALKRVVIQKKRGS